MGGDLRSVGIDIGGTFTDLVGLRDGAIVIDKTSTVVADPTEGIARTLANVAADAHTIERFVHGSTIAINTVLERKGARTALVSTEGFRDVYAIGRSNRPEGFNLNFRRPRPLIDRTLCYEVPERLNATGDVLVPLDEAAVEAVALHLVASGIDAVAVCFLHSYANPVHEQRAGALLRRLCPGIFVTLSSDLLREYREYERTSTTALNAYVGPRVAGYLDRLDATLARDAFSGSVQIMRSNGGTMSLAQARAQPVAMMESGPVAGMIGAGKLARVLGYDQAIGFDMGGTTAKASMFRAGTAAVHDEYYIGGYASGLPLQLPVIDIIEIGSGGGSIAWLDDFGALHVGPQSAGADPGPACYGLGGVDPVVTDADLVLGRLNAGRFLSGHMVLDPKRSINAIRTKIADRLGLSVEEAALGINQIADNAMSLAVRSVSVARGFDPRDCAMIAFGGAGPLHASSIARDIAIPTVVIPRFPGNFSALGMLSAPWRQDFARTFVASLGDIDKAAARDVMQGLEDSARAQLADEGIAPNRAQFAFAADLRYLGQEHAISVPFAEAADLAKGGSQALRGDFDSLHHVRYGHAAPNEQIQVANLRLAVTVEQSEQAADDWLTLPFIPEDPQAEQIRRVTYIDADQPIDTRIVWRPGLEAGTRIDGPAVIEEPNSTTVLYPGDRALVSEVGHLIVSVGSPGKD